MEKFLELAMQDKARWPLYLQVVLSEHLAKDPHGRRTWRKLLKQVLNNTSADLPQMANDKERLQAVIAGLKAGSLQSLAQGNDDESKVIDYAITRIEDAMRDLFPVIE